MEKLISELDKVKNTLKTMEQLGYLILLKDQLHQVELKLHNKAKTIELPRVVFLIEDPMRVKLLITICKEVKTLILDLHHLTKANHLKSLQIASLLQQQVLVVLAIQVQDSAQVVVVELVQEDLLPWLIIQVNLHSQECQIKELQPVKHTLLIYD